jgi:hypothetical protein
MDLTDGSTIEKSTFEKSTFEKSTFEKGGAKAKRPKRSGQSEAKTHLF